MESESGVSTGGDDHLISSEGSSHVTLNTNQVDEHVIGDVGVRIPQNDEYVTQNDHVAQEADHVIQNDHVTQEADHVTQNNGHVDGPGGEPEVESDEDTAGEVGDDILPHDSTSTTTTDAINDPMEPIDFIETRPHHHAHCFNGAIATGHASTGLHYENWSVLAELSESARKGKSMKRMRIVKSERSRVPYPIPRPGKAKTQYSRPSPSSRKKRLSGRLMRPPQPANASEEGDMAQADEMGEEGKDDGFVEGLDSINRRRNKKRPGGIHVLLPPPGGGGSPPSSPSNTPVSRRRTSSRKSRLKPRSRKQSKPQLAPADVSTQESTTQGPGSSDSSDGDTSPDDETTPLRSTGDNMLESCEEEGDESRSLTPNPRDPTPLSIRQDAPKASRTRRLDHVSDIHSTHPAPVLDMTSKGGGGCPRFDSNETTSDTDHHSLNPPKEGAWLSRRFESDLSTAPFSSETSDVDTSGNERGVAAESQVVAVGGDGVKSPGPPITKRTQGKGERKGVGPGLLGGSAAAIEAARSGSSGEEGVARKRLMKKPILAKPPLPSAKPHAAEPHPQSQSGSSVPVKKPPLQATKSNPLANRVVHSTRPSPASSRSLSSKQNLSTRPKPKPPVGAKPLVKPAPPPKPQAKNPGVGVAAKPPLKPPVNHTLRSSSSSSQGVLRPRPPHSTSTDQPTTAARRGLLKNSQSVDVSGTQDVKAAPRKISRGPGEDRREVNAPKPLPKVPMPANRPSVPTKPRRLSTETRPPLTLTKAQSSVSVPARHVSDSSKNPSSSDVTTSGQSQSNSPYPSPASQKRPLPLSKAGKPGKRHIPPPTKGGREAIVPIKPGVGSAGNSEVRGQDGESSSHAPAITADSAPGINAESSHSTSRVPESSDGSAVVSSSSAIAPSTTVPSSSSSNVSTHSSTPASASGGSSTHSGTPVSASGGSSHSMVPGPVMATSSSSSSNVSTHSSSRGSSQVNGIGRSSHSMVPGPHSVVMATTAPANDVGSDGPVLMMSELSSLRDTVASPSPPPIPTRGEKAELGTTTPPLPLRGADLASESTTPSPRPRSKPRRPPPQPPGGVLPPPQATTSVAQPTSSIPTTGERRQRSNTPTQLSDIGPPITQYRSSTRSGLSTSTLVASGNSEPEVGTTKSKDRYFGPHQNRDSVPDVSYAVVKRSSLRLKPEPEEPSQDTAGDQGGVVTAGGQSGVEPSHTSYPRKLGPTRRPPPKSPKSMENTYESIDEIGKRLLARQTTEKGHSLLMQRNSFSPPLVLDEDEPPPLPSRPAPKLKSTSAAQLRASSSSPMPGDVGTHQALVKKDSVGPLPVPKPREPVYDEIPTSAFKKKPQRRDYEEIILPEFEGDIPRLWVPPEKEKQGKEGVDGGSGSGKSSPMGGEKKEGVGVSISLVQENVVSRLTSTGPIASLALEDLRENWDRNKTQELSPTAPLSPLPSPLSSHFRARQARSFTSKSRNSLMYNRISSERSLKSKALTLDSINRKLVRSSSLDHLDDRMERSTRNSIHHEVSSDSEDEDEPVVSPSALDLPKVPSGANLYRVPRSHRKPAGPFLCPPDVEPLYQYINTAEFLREPEEGGMKIHESPESVEGKKQNQLELARHLSCRKLWCELPEVIKSGVLDMLTSEERKLQEAIFEVISTEDSYLRSLDVLIQHFMDDPGMNPHLPEGRRVMDKRQHHVIFSNTKEVREVSARFLEKLHSRQRESAVVRNITDIILDFSENHFDCYIRYCTNQVYQIREMQDMIANPSNVMFRDYLRRLESDKCCQNLNIQSFLLLPMQRITRLPLLILAILNRTPLDHPDHDLVEKTLRSVQTLVTACNDGARQMDRTEQLHEIHRKLEFGKLKPFPLVSLSRQLERRGTLVSLQVEQKLLGKLKIKKKPLYLFVFTDYIIITKRKKDPKGDYIYRVKDYASRAVVEVEWLDTHPGVSFPKFGEQNPLAKATYAVSTAGAKHAFLLLFLDSAGNKDGKYTLLAQNDTDKTRWMECLKRPDQKDEEKIYQHWDCPQVQALYDYQAQQPDELGLERGDVVKVYRKMADGWYEGERLRDTQWGWFPSNFTEEVENAHTRARNLRQTHKLNCTTGPAQV